MMTGDRRDRFSLCVRPLLTLALVVNAAAARSEEPEDRSRGPYCGIYCVYSALATLGKQVEFESLIQPKYLGSSEGSSIGELRRAAEDVGAHAVALSGLNFEGLRNARHPMILHVASDGQLNRYDHWVLFLGMDGDKARILDAPSPPDSVPLSQVLARWDGTALIVSGRPIRVSSVAVRVSGFHVLYVLLAAGVIILARLSMRRRPMRGGVERHSGRLWAAALEAVILLVASVGMALAIHMNKAAGFLRNPAATSYVAAANVAKFFPKFSLDEARRFQSRAEGVLIDARFRESYAAGHIEGAINVPIDATSAERHQILADLSRETPVLVYCQSLPCEFDEHVATLMARDGFRTISIYPGGWEEWSDDKRHSR